MARSKDKSAHNVGLEWAPVGLVSDNVSDSIAVVDRNWRFVYLNHGARRDLAGGHDLVGHNLWEAFPQLHDHELGSLYRQCMVDGQPREAETHFADLSNWFRVRAVPVPLGLAVFFRVVTADRERDQALRSSTAQLAGIFTSLTYGVLIHDRSGAIIDANPAAERILGLARNQLRALPPHSAIWRAVDAAGHDLPGELYPSMVALHHGQAVRDFIMGIYNPKCAERRWLSIDACPIRDGQGETASHVYEIFADVTEQLRAKRDLEQSRLFMAVAQRVTSVGSAAIDFRTEKWTWSEQTCRIYGVDPEHFIPSAETLAQLVHPEDREALLAAPALARRGLTPAPLEYRIIRPDGRERLVRREAALMHGRDGEVLGIVGTVQDVTEVRAAERQRAELQAQLNHAQRLDALGTLAGGIAHDLNNTLVPVVALSEAITNSLAPDDERRPLVELIKNAGERGRDLVGQVLAFTRHDSPNSERIDLALFLRATMGLIRASIPSSIEIREQIEPVRPIIADPAQLHQVLLNLFTNAAHAIGDAPGHILLALGETCRDANDRPSKDGTFFARISVTDSGCGMDEHIRARAFDPFFTTKCVGKGSGLGLAVVHGIVVAHGGRIAITSNPGEGACFDVYLPLA